jgi:TRAP-type C4-dicarboxylate transport system substrate-binding protein
VRVLEVPMLIQTYDELDFVRARLDADLRKKFDDKGYVLLAWGDVGPVHLFSATPIRSRDDLMKARVWEWADDPISKKMFERTGAPGVPLGVPDVLPSLSTGMINAAFGSPLATLALQWHTRMRYMTSLNFGQALGATVITHREFDRLTPAEKQLLLDESATLQKAVLSQIRGENERALAALRKSGLVVVDTPKEMAREFEKIAVPMRDELEPALYSHDFRQRVEKLVAEFRAGKK